MLWLAAASIIVLLLLLVLLWLFLSSFVRLLSVGVVLHSGLFLLRLMALEAGLRGDRLRLSLDGGESCLNGFLLHLFLARASCLSLLILRLRQAQQRINLLGSLHHHCIGCAQAILTTFTHRRQLLKLALFRHLFLWLLLGRRGLVVLVLGQLLVFLIHWLRWLARNH